MNTSHSCISLVNPLLFQPEICCDFRQNNYEVLMLWRKREVDKLESKLKKNLFNLEWSPKMRAKLPFYYLHSKKMRTKAGERCR